IDVNNASGYLYVTDGTPGNIVEMKDQDGAVLQEPLMETDLNGDLYFLAQVANTYHLYRSNGMTVAPASIYTFPASYGANGYMAAINNHLYFGGYTEDGLEPWTSDGTTAGTVEIKDIYAGTNSSAPYDFLLFK